MIAQEGQISTHSPREAGPARQSDLLIGERRRGILELLALQSRVTVQELTRRYGVSAATIRTDLTALAASGACERTHGGALLSRDGEDHPIAVKRTLHHAEKLRIAQVAAALIGDGQTIILDAGTTTAEVAKRIRSLPLRSLNVITNALNIATLLAEVPFVRLIMTGGELRPQSNAFSGHHAETMIETLNADTMFLGADALDPERGVMTPHLMEAQLAARMLSISRRVIVVADSSKLLRRNIRLVAPLDQIDMLITDANANPKALAQLRERGLEVRIA